MYREKEGFEIGHRHHIACVPRCAMRPDTISRGLKSRHWRDFALRAAPFSPLLLLLPRKKAPDGAFFRGGEGVLPFTYTIRGFFECRCSNSSPKTTPLEHGKSGAVFAVFHLFLQNLLPILHMLILVSILGVFAYASLSNFAFFAVFTPDFAFTFIWRHKRVNRALFINNMICSL